MKSAISTACFYPMPAEEALVKSARLGFDACEVFLNTFGELEAGFMKKLRSIAQNEGIKIIAVHSPFGYAEPNFLYSQYTRRTEESLAMFRKFIENAGSIFGSINFVFHGGYLRLKNPPEVDIGIYKKLYGFGKECKVTVCQENVNLYFLAELKNIKEMKDSFPDCRFTIDIKQARRSGLDPFDVLRAMGNNIGHFHINDFDDENDCLLPGDGHFGLRAFTKELKASGYDSYAVIEVYRSQSGDDGKLKRARSFVESL